MTHDNDTWNEQAFINNDDELNKTNSSKINYAILVGQTDVIKVLIENGADVNEKYLGSPPIVWAIRQGLAKPKPCLRESGSTLGGQGKTEVVKELINMGANVNALDESDTPILNLTIYNGQLDLARTLIEHGANVNASDKQGETLGWNATELHSNPKSIPQGETPLIAAIIEGHVDFAKFLIDKKADINARDFYGTPTLIWAVIEDQPEIVQLLVDAKVNVNAKDVFASPRRGSLRASDEVKGKTALMWAVETGKYKITQILQSIDNTKSDSGKTKII
jgi:ankyrin repeat protein